MPEELKIKVNSFMKENFMEIQKSFSHWDNLDTIKAWFRRFANRLIGANPPWEIRNGGTSDNIETFLRGERVLSNMLVAPLISRLFMESGEAVLKVVSPTTSDAEVELQNLPAESARLEQSEQSPCISDMGSIEGIDKALLAIADAGDSDAQCKIGLLYADGEKIPRDNAQAALWFRRAAEQGNARAQFCLGFCYQDGRGTLQDYSQAATWLRKSAKQGNADAQFSLSELLFCGNGISQNYAESYFWMYLASLATKKGDFIGTGAIDIHEVLVAMAAKLTPSEVFKAQERATWFIAHPQVLTGQGGTNGHE
jgi:hypothetical protein